MNETLRIGDLRWPSWRRVAAALAVGAVIGVVAGVALGIIRGPRHEAQANVLVQATPTSALSLLMNGTSQPIGSGDMVDVALLATSTPVLQATVDALADPGVTLTDLEEWVTAEPVSASHLVQVTVEAVEADLAAVVATVLADALVEEQRQQVASVLEAVPASGADPAVVDSFGETLRTRAEMIDGGLVPLRVMSVSAAEQTAPGPLIPAALGIVGMAAAAMLVVGRSLLPSTGTGRDRRPTAETASASGATAEAASPATRRVAATRSRTAVLEGDEVSSVVPRS